MTNVVETALIKYANQDLKLARKHGNICIVYTKPGPTYVSYDKTTRTYGIRAGNAVSEVIVKKELAVKMLVSLYTLINKVA